MAKKFSQFPFASSISPGDSVVGLKDGANTRFSFATVFSYMQNLFVLTSRKVNNKPLTADITLDASDVGAVDTADVGVADGVASLDSNGKVPGTQLDLSGKQSTITASGILKGDGQGGVSAATAGTDYGTYSKPSGGIPSTDMTSAVQTSLGKADTAYQKPSSGIPSSDMASGVQTSLGKADTAYQKPSGGIPASDLASGVIPTVPSAYTSNPAMDGTASPGSSGAWAKGDHVHPSDTSRVPVYGLGKNLLRNAYFVGGGTGRGVFPVNQRGNTSYSSNTSGTYSIDNWKVFRGTANLQTTGLSLAWGGSSSGNYGCYIRQYFDLNSLLGRTVTFSAFTESGLHTFSFEVSSSYQIDSDTIDDWTLSSTTESTLVTITIWRKSQTAKLLYAAKLELGTEQTLCHNEGTAEAPVWVLNEVPDYEYELYRCMTSTADSTDTYANKTLATEQQLAYVESGTTASRDYLWDEFFWMGGILYRTTKRVNNGAPFTVGTNCEAVTSGGLNKMTMRLLGATVGSETIQPPSYQCLVLATRTTGAFLGILYTVTTTTWYLIRIHNGISDISLNTSTGAITFPSYTQYVYFW